jgi:hypothetical protein
MPDRIVRRRRDGLVQIRPARVLERARPVVRDLLVVAAVVVVGTLAYFTLMTAFYLLVVPFGLWAVRTLWRELRPRPPVRRATERPRLAVVRAERRSR